MVVHNTVATTRIIPVFGDIIHKICAALVLCLQVLHRTEPQSQTTQLLVAHTGTDRQVAI